MGKKREPVSPSDSDSALEAMAQTKTSRDLSPSPDPSKTSKKRKATEPDAEELEIDVNLPEPPSKKAARKAKKAKTKPATEGGVAETETTTTTGAETKDGDKIRSAHGIWIGNLPFSCDKTVLRVFFTRQGSIPDDQITRVHMPVPREQGGAAPQQPGGRPKPSNKGFAYVDFATPEALATAIAMSETLMTGRKVLIKDAKSFEGRPEKATATTNALGVAAGGDGTMAAKGRDGRTAGTGGKEPSKRVFVGNLGFDVSKDDLEAHFAQAGEVEDVHMATFEDTGKCKGFAWVRFVELSAAEAAVKGFIFKEEAGSDDDEEEAEESAAESSDGDSDAEGEKVTKPKKAKKAKKQKKRKWFINRLLGRPLRCEFAEDAASRYKKRFGKSETTTPRTFNNSAAGGEGITEVADGGKPEFKRRDRSGDKDARQEQRRKKHVDARTIRPGAALANAPRASGAIVEGKGKKISFD